MKKDNVMELIRYIVVGGCTTLINFIVYYVFIEYLHQEWLLSNIVAWLAAVIFAFFTNRSFVFKSGSDSKKEAIQFFLLRIVTLAIENVLLFVCIDLLFVQTMLSKLIVSFVTIVSNYWLCKFKIFGQQKEGLSHEEN